MGDFQNKPVNIYETKSLKYTDEIYCMQHVTNAQGINSK